MHKFSLALLAVLAACAPDYGVTETPTCDGVLQAGEDTVDAPFDRDGDGAFDGTNPDCAATYDAAVLDCNDADPDVNPLVSETLCNGVDDDCDAETPDEGADFDGDGYSECDDCDDDAFERNPGNTEILCNNVDDDCDSTTLDTEDFDADGVNSCTDCNDLDPAIYPGRSETCGDELDNDCDGDVDEECSDWSGTWALDTAPSYSCGWGSVNISFAKVLLEDLSPTLSVTSIGGSQPGNMFGSLSGTSFTVSRTIAGTCTEVFTLTGEFTSDDTFVADFYASFSGSFCVDCADQTWLGITGTRL